MTADTQKLTELNIDIAAWEQTRDDASIARLDACISPHLIFRRADRSVIGKDTFMSGLREASPFVARESRDVTVAFVGERALVSLLVIGTRADGSVGRYRNVRVFVCDRGAWRLDVWVNDPVVTAPEL